MVLGSDGVISLKYVSLQAIIGIVIVLFVFSNACAEVHVALEPEINTRILRVGAHEGGVSYTQTIQIIANVNKQNVKFSWNIEGPQKDFKEISRAKFLYTPPDTLFEDQPTWVRISVVATDENGNKDEDRLTFLLIPWYKQEFFKQLRKRTEKDLTQRNEYLKEEINEEIKKYEKLINDESAPKPTSVNDRIIPILSYLIELLKENEIIFGEHPKWFQTPPNVLFRKKLEDELILRLFIADTVLSTIIQAEVFFDKGLYLTSDNKNAFEMYKKALQQEPENQEARERIHTMASYYLKSADDKYHDNSNEALSAYQKYLIIAEYLMQYGDFEQQKEYDRAKQRSEIIIDLECQTIGANIDSLLRDTLPKHLSSYKGLIQQRDAGQLIDTNQFLVSIKAIICDMKAIEAILQADNFNPPDPAISRRLENLRATRIGYEREFEQIKYEN